MEIEADLSKKKEGLGSLEGLGDPTERRLEVSLSSPCSPMWTQTPVRFGEVTVLSG